MTFVVVREQDFVMKENPKAREIAKVLFENFSNEMIAKEIGYEADVIQINKQIKEFTEHNRSLDYKDLDYKEIEIPLYSEIEVLDKTVSEIGDFLKLDKSNYVGLHIHHFGFNQISEHFNVKKVVKFTNTAKINQSLPELIHCSLKTNEDVELLIIKGMLVHQVFLDSSARSIPTRILHKLGVNRFVVIGNVFGADENIEVGDLYLPTDHMNLSVLNPTQGKNIDEWGRRFYDVSKCYDNGLIDKFKELAEKIEGCNVWKSHLFYVNNAKPYAGRAEQRFCKGMGEINGYDCKGVSFQGYSEMMTIRHMDFEDLFKTIYIGVISDKCVNQAESFGVENIDMESYRKGINNVMTVFEEFVTQELFK